MYYILKERRIIKCFAVYRQETGPDPGMRDLQGNGYKKGVGSWNKPSFLQLFTVNGLLFKKFIEKSLST